MRRALLDNRLNLLLVAAPVSWVLYLTSPGSPWIFFSAAVSLIPLAGIIGLGTEELARRSGPAWGGFLNATFGNAAELIIAVVALRNGHIALEFNSEGMFRGAHLVFLAGMAPLHSQDDHRAQPGGVWARGFSRRRPGRASY